MLTRLSSTFFSHLAHSQSFTVVGCSWGLDEGEPSEKQNISDGGGQTA